MPLHGRGRYSGSLHRPDRYCAKKIVCRARAIVTSGVLAFASKHFESVDFLLGQSCTPAGCLPGPNCIYVPVKAVCQWHNRAFKRGNRFPNIHKDPVDVVANIFAQRLPVCLLGFVPNGLAGGISANSGKRPNSRKYRSRYVAMT